MGTNFTIHVFAELGIESALREMKKQMGKSGLRVDMARHESYTKPGERKRLKAAKVRRRRLKAQRRTAQQAARRRNPFLRIGR
jgi:ribosomal protein S21